MRQFWLCILSLLFLAGCSMYGLKNHTTTIGMFTPHVLFPIKYHGQIKKVSEKVYLAKEVNGKVLIERPLTIADRNGIGWSDDFEAQFNSEGLVTQCNILDGEDHIIQVYRNQIENGKVVKFDIIEKDTLRKYLSFFYDKKGFIDYIKSYDFPGNTFLGDEDFSTDGNGNITFIQFFDVAGQSEMKFNMDLDKTGRRIAYTQFAENGKKLSGANIVYNSKGFIETKSEANEMGQVNVWTYEYEYDKMGNWIQCLVRNKKHQLLIIRTYDYYSEI